ncbi:MULTISPECIES: hypothetical protein [unclassified Kitasatospora]|uniref:hypothetical protein n=1 Tax=unclassified Kitasatospora TaxID=2633591 RepID=UPI0033FE7010
MGEGASAAARGRAAQRAVDGRPRVYRRPVEANRADRIPDEEKVAHLGEQPPLGRAAQPAEMAPAYVFPASQESSWCRAVRRPVAVSARSPQ